MLKDFTLHRLNNFKIEIDSILSRTFPRREIRNAFLEIQYAIELDIKRLKSGVINKGLDTYCNNALAKLFLFTPIVGCLLDSMDVRNAFEVIGPLSRLANKLLASHESKKNRSLIISSEWDYSPLIRRFAEMDGFVFVSLPAPESKNPLLLPLVGHELGHLIWDEENLVEKANEALTKMFYEEYPTKKEQSNLLSTSGNKPLGEESGGDDNMFHDILVNEIASDISEMVLGQAQEVFSDIIGLVIFKQSFLYAFSYLLSPQTGSGDDEHPETGLRMKYLQAVAAKFAIDYDNKITDCISTSSIGKTTRADNSYGGFLERKAREYLGKLCETSLVQFSEQFLQRATFLKNSNNSVADILRHFRILVPYDAASNLIDIVNGGWMAFLDQTLWGKEVGIPPERKIPILFDLILKNIEILEIKELTEEYHASQSTRHSGKN